MSTQACTHVQGSLLLLRLFRATWTRLDHARAVGYRKFTHLQAVSLILSELRHAHRPVSPPHPLGQNCAMQVSPRRLAITRARARAWGGRSAVHIAPAAAQAQRQRILAGTKQGLELAEKNADPGSLSPPVKLSWTRTRWWDPARKRCTHGAHRHRATESLVWLLMSRRLWSFGLGV